MSTNEVESNTNQHAAIPPREAEGSADQWTALTCPQKKPPRYLFKEETRDSFDRHFARELAKCQDMFNEYFKGSKEERLRVEENLKKELPHVIASEGWRQVLDSLTAQYWLSLIIPLLPIILSFVMPWLIANRQWQYNVLVAFLGIIGATILTIALVMISPLFEPNDLFGSFGLLIMLALTAGCFGGLYAKQPTGWELWATPVAAFGLLCALLFVVNLVSNLSSALISHVTIARYFNTELSYCILSILCGLSESPEEYTVYMAKQSYYVGNLIERHWQRLLTAQTSPPAVQRQVRDTIRCFAAGMYEIGFKVTFLRKEPDPESLESKLVDTMASQLTALTTFRYGDLFKSKPQEVGARPRLQKVLRGLRSVIAAIAPITLLLVLPKAFNFDISADLYGTLLTVSLAWLAIYVIGWLDPRGLTNVSSLTNVTSLFTSNKHGD